MKTSRPITWSRLKVLFGTLLLALFALGLLAAYASSVVDPQRGSARSNLRILAAALMALAVLAAVLAKLLRRQLWQDE